MKDFYDNKTPKDFLPEGFQVDKIINEATAKIKEIEKTISQLPPDRVRPYDFRPNSADRRPPVTLRKNLIKLFNTEIDSIKAQVEQKITAIADKSTLAVKEDCQKKLEQFKNPLRQQYKSLKEKSSVKKDISDSQDLAGNMISLSSQFRERKQKEQLAGRENSSEKKEKVDMPSISTMFTTKLGFTKLKEETKEQIVKSEKSREKEFDKDR